MDAPDRDIDDQKPRRGVLLLIVAAGVALIAMIAFAATRESDVASQDSEQESTDTPAETTTTTTSDTTTTLAEPDSPERQPVVLSDEEREEVVRRNVGIFVGVDEARSPGLADTLERLTEEHFSPETGTRVEFVDRELRGIGSMINGVQDRPPDVMLVPVEVSTPFGSNGWLQDLTPFVEADPGYESEDLLPSIRDAHSSNDVVGSGEFFAAPFTGESTILMYNRRILASAGISVPDQPTWEEIADIADQVHSDDVAGICLSGTGDWTDLGASLTTVVNTFGGTWWEANEDGATGEARIDQPDSNFRAAAEFYVDLARNFGPANPETLDGAGCQEHMANETAAIWFGTTTGAQVLNAGSLNGNLGVARAPVGPTQLPGGGLWGWGLSILPASETTDLAWEFISWATSAEYIELVGETNGWENVPSGTRFSTYENPDYQAANGAFADVALAEILDADPNNPGTTPRPGWPGVQSVSIPEFPDVATRCGEQITLAIASDLTTDEALNACQQIAAEVTR